MDTNIRELLKEEQEAVLEFLQLQSGPVLAEIIERSKGFSEQDDLNSTLEFLFRLLSDRAAGVMALLGMGLTWDAEIVLRPYYECAAKILFITHPANAGKSELVAEFWDALGGISDKKRSRKSQYSEEMFPPSDKYSRDVFRLLQQPKMHRPIGGMNKVRRNALEQKWSFSVLVDAMDKFKGRKSNEYKSLLHIYGVASHLIHSDSVAIDFMLDRSLREPQERALLNASQTSRIMSDITSLGIFCTSSIFKTLQIESDALSELSRIWREVSEMGEKISSEFHKTQIEFYGQQLGADDQDSV